MASKKILMNVKTEEGYDELYPKTLAKQVITDAENRFVSDEEKALIEETDRDFRSYQESGGGYNWIINSDFEIWQRGEDFTSSSSIYTADRWKMINIGSTSNVSKYVKVSGKTCLKWKLLASGDSLLNYRFEDKDFLKFRGKAVSFSITLTRLVTWISGDIHILINFDGLYHERYIPIDQCPINQQVTFKMENITVPLSLVNIVDISIKNGSTNIGAEILLENVTFQLSNKVVPELPRSYAEKLTLCERYFEKSYDINVKPGTAVGINSNPEDIGEFLSPIYINHVVRYKTRKRIIATPTVYDIDGNIGKIEVDGITNVIPSIIGHYSEIGFKIWQNSAKRTTFHWATDAELY